MLREKPRPGARPFESDVKLLPQASVEQKNAFEVVWAKARVGIEKAAEAFCRSQSIMDLARFNDMALRAVLQLPDSMLRNSRDRELFFDKLMREARAHVSRNLPGTAQQEFGERTVSFRSSILQLVGFVVADRQRSPDNLFATSVHFDVHYGIDLIKMRSWWNDQLARLDISVGLYQAKGSRTGLSDAEVRDVASKYRPKQARVLAEVEFDPDWLVARTRERSGVTEKDVVESLKDAERAIALVRKMAEARPSTALEQFVHKDRLYRLSQVFRPGGSPSEGNAPHLKMVPQPAFRFIVDTRQGTKILTDIEAEQYPTPVAPPAPRKPREEAIAAK